jgi:hypothetical protein
VYAWSGANDVRIGIEDFIVQLLTYFVLVHTSQPIEVVAPFFKQINTFLEKLITWPRDVGKAIWTCQSSFPSPT